MINKNIYDVRVIALRDLWCSQRGLSTVQFCKDKDKLKQLILCNFLQLFSPRNISCMFLYMLCVLAGKVYRINLY